jgi:hypothetical protein
MENGTQSLNAAKILYRLFSLTEDTEDEIKKMSLGEIHACLNEYSIDPVKSTKCIKESVEKALAIYKLAKDGPLGN